MGKRWLMAWGAGCLATAAAASPNAGLTPTESRWIDLSWPIVVYAREQGLPLDIVVQPQATPGTAPLAMAYVDKRCKLVLSMRGNPLAEETLAAIPENLLAPVMEAMAAHELGHCWRYVRGVWNTLPAGFAAAENESRPPADPLLDAQARQMIQTRREEGFADLVGLAWAAQRHPARYAQVHAWLVGYRDEPVHPGSHHDTMTWVKLAADAAAFQATGSLFEQAWPLWQRGLRTSN